MRCRNPGALVARSAVIVSLVCLALGTGRADPFLDGIKAPKKMTPLGDLVQPEREQDLVRILTGDRARYAAAEPGGERNGVRLQIQTHVIAYMRRSQLAHQWVGVLVDKKETEEGFMWVRIEVGDGVTIADWPARKNDPYDATLILPSSPLYAQIRDMDLGQPVVFDALLLVGRTAPDDEMVKTPEIIAHFYSVKPLDAPPSQPAAARAGAR